MAALEGMRILDLTQYEAGTTCTQTLGWLGADVVKIEPPQSGDPGRTADGNPGDKDSLYFVSLNHNKRSLALDLRSMEGREIFLRLVPRFDVVVENFTLGTMEKLDLGYDVLKVHNPGVIYATIKGFGASGPYSGFKCFDDVALAAGGATAVTGERDGTPMRPGPTFADTGTGMAAAIAILGAYVQKLRTGEGQVVEISMQETIINFMRTMLSFSERYEDGVVPRRGNRQLSPTNLYQCSGDGANDYVYLMPVTQRMWEDLAAAIGRADLASDERFATFKARHENGDALDAEIADWTRTRNKFDVMETLAKAGVPVSAVFDTRDIVEHPHLVGRGQVVTYEHPTRGPVRMPGPPMRMSGTDVTMRRAPLLGEHSHEVLREDLGLGSEEVERLAASGVVNLGRPRAQPSPAGAP